MVGRSERRTNKDNNYPQVAVIMPAYNAEQYIGQAIESVFAQSYPYWELIIVDDGSTDDSREVVANFEDQVRYIYQENKGLAGARNTGIRAAKGTIIGFLDADDQWLPNYLEVMVALADQNPEIAVFYCCAQSMDQDGHDLPQIFGVPPHSPDSMYEILLRANFLIPSTILMRRDVVMAAGLFDESLRSCEDWDLWLRLLPDYGFIGTAECLVRYRLHEGSLSADPTGMQQATRCVIEKHFGPDDEQYQTWSWEKRRAYGGVYRYYVLTSAQRQNDWQSAADYLRQALQYDPTLCTDIDLFYDLAHTNQPNGYRGTSYQLALEKNAELINQLLCEVFNSLTDLEVYQLLSQTSSSANFALGLIAYSIGKLKLSRKILLKAIRFQPFLVFDKRTLSIYLKSILGNSLIWKIRNLRKSIHYQE